MNDVRILIIDDEQAIRNLLRVTLEPESFLLAESPNGEEGLKQAEKFHPHLIILDLALPDMSGLEVLKRLRKWTTVPIIILTVSEDEKTKVTLLDAGADDYLTKPFGKNELIARIRVSLRHAGMVEATPIFESDDLVIDVNQKLVSVSGKVVKLTATEFEVLARLVRDHGKVVTQNLLLKQIWGAHAQEESHYLRIYINQLRKKIEKNPSEPTHILTEPGVGYRLV